MEHDVEALPIDPSTLAELAQGGHAYAKALHYRELEFQKSPLDSFESLININKKLDQYDAALGVLKVFSVAMEYSLPFHTFHFVDFYYLLEGLSYLISTLFLLTYSLYNVLRNVHVPFRLCNKFKVRIRGRKTQ